MNDYVNEQCSYNTVNAEEYNASKVYGWKERVYLYGCELESLVNNNSYQPMTWDGSETFNLDASHWRIVYGNPRLWALDNNKPPFSDQYPNNGLGRVVLKKAFPFLDQLTQENTIYIIQYDFDLNGAGFNNTDPVEIPAGCVLLFEGGSLRNGTIMGNNTIIVSKSKIFSNTVCFLGSFNCEEIESYWWEIHDNNPEYDNKESLQKGIDLASLNQNGKYHISGKRLYVDIAVPDHTYDFWYCSQGALNMKSNVHVTIDEGTTIKAINNRESHYSIFHFFDINNASIEGGNIIGDVDTNANNKTGEWGYGVCVMSSNDISIRNCKISYCHGDGVYIGRHHDKVTYPIDMTNRIMVPKNITVEGCTISYCGRQGISVCGAINSRITSNKIYGIGNGGYGTNPQSAIDVEPNPSLYDEIVDNLIVSYCVFYMNHNGSVMIADFSDNLRMLNNVVVSDCISGSIDEPLSLRLHNAYNTYITNCKFTYAIIETTKINDELVNVNNCSFSGRIIFETGAKDIILSNCSMYGNAETSMLAFNGNNENIFFNNCSIYQNDRREAIHYEPISVDILYDKIIYNNCSFVTSQAQSQDTIGVHNNSVWAIGPLYH